MGLIATKRFKLGKKEYNLGDKVVVKQSHPGLGNLVDSLHVLLVPDGKEDEAVRMLRETAAHPRLIAQGHGLMYDTRAVSRAIRLGYPLPEGATLGKGKASEGPTPKKAAPKKVAPSTPKPEVFEEEDTKDIEVPNIVALGVDDAKEEPAKAAKKAPSKKKPLFKKKAKKDAE